MCQRRAGAACWCGAEGWRCVPPRALRSSSAALQVSGRLQSVQALQDIHACRYAAVLCFSFNCMQTPLKCHKWFWASHFLSHSMCSTFKYPKSHCHGRAKVRFNSLYLADFFAVLFYFCFFPPPSFWTVLLRDWPTFIAAQAGQIWPWFAISVQCEPLQRNTIQSAACRAADWTVTPQHMWSDYKTENIPTRHLTFCLMRHLFL